MLLDVIIYAVYVVFSYSLLFQCHFRMIKLVYHQTADNLIHFQNLFCLFIVNITHKF